MATTGPPNPPAPPPPPTITCYRHSKAAAPVTCRRCERPICTSCMVSAPVGWQCPGCVKDAPPVRRLGDLPAFERPVVSIVLIAACVLAHLPSLASGTIFSGSNPLSDDFALNTFFVGEGEWWRLFTSGFLHFGLIHLGFNMAMLYRLGLVLETNLGRVRYSAVYVASLLGGSLGVVLLTGDSLFTRTAGASGAVYGLMGAALVLPRDRFDPFQADLGGLLAINLVLTIVLGFSLGGHLGGLALGLLCGGIIRVLGSRSGARWAGAAMCTGLAVASFGAAIAVAAA